MLITLEMAKDSLLGRKMLLSKLNLHSPKHSFLTTYILQEISNKNSKWKPYLQILPQSYDNFPIFYTEEEKNLLIGSPFLKIIKDKLRDVEADYNMIVKVKYL